MVPIIIEGEHLGNFYIGQFFFEPPDMELFRNQAKQFGFDEDEYLEAVSKVPIHTRDELEPYANFVSMLGQLVGEMD